MNRIFIVWVLLLYVSRADAQLYDAQWAFAPNPSVLDFENDTITTYPIHAAFNIFLTSASISDSAGNLLYITNGINIYDRNGNVLPGDTGLNPCPYTQQWVDDGLNIQQGALFIPKPGSSGYYYLFSFSNDTVNEGRPGTLYYSLLDSAGNVLNENVPFCKGVFREGGMTACKHGNGRDYWLVMGKHWSNAYYTFLVTPHSISQPLIQEIGPEYVPPYDNAYSKFSQDGSKYVTGAIEGLITVMDFDRCSGVFSNPVTIWNEASQDLNNPTSGCVAVEFSPNGRFVYVSDRINLNQYDLSASNIQDSAQIYSADSGDNAQMDMLQLAPNGKLYATPWNGGFYFLHIINYPDLKGDSCGFVYGGFSTLTEDDDAFPNMINYNLGPLIGSPCDTIPDSPATIRPLAENNLLRIMPNPADKYLYVEMGGQGNYEFQLLNRLGQLVDTKETRQVDIFDIENFASGIYFIKAIDKNNSNNILTEKIIIQH